MDRKELKIGLFGFGCVGNGLYDLLQKTPQLNATIVKICVKNKDKKRSLASHCFTYDANDILNNDEINTIVELIDDSEAAFEIVKKAMEKGKAVVSANKKMIAEHFIELLNLQEKYNVPFLYEASCCASIPIIRNLEEYYDNDFLNLIQGIVNGSTNYILTQIVEQNTSYSNALEKAQNNGFAESNPIMDVCGFDAKYKLLILIAHAYGAVLKSQDILNIGIDQLTDMDFQFAKEKGLKIKLIAHAKKDENDAISAFVMPMFIQSSDKLYSVDNEYNAVKIVSSFSDTQYFFGKGAGSYPTSSAVISDISALTYNYKYEYKKLGSSIGLQKDEMVDLKIYLRCRIDESIELVHHFSEIEENYSNSMHSYTIGLITLKQLKLILNLKKPVSIVLFEALEFQSKVSVNYIEEMQFHEVNN